MKKFTSLFALLSCLCVVSAQAETTINSLTIAGTFNGWNRTSDPLVSVGDNVWSYNLLLNDNSSDVMFKFVVNNYDNYLGYYNNGITVDAPDLWVESVQSDNYNFKLNNSRTGFKTYKVTATWTPSDDVYTGWNIKVEGLETRHTYTVAGTGALFPTAWAPTDSYFDMSLAPDGCHFIFNKVLELSGGNFEFKVVEDHSWNYGSYPFGENNNYVVRDYGGAGTYEVKISFYPPKQGDGVSCELVNMANQTLTIVDGEPFLAESNFTVASATYSRNTGNNQWGTLCLPFSITNPTSGVTFYQLSSVANNVMTFSPYSGNIPAGTPVAFKLADNTTSLSITESNVNVVANPQNTSGDWTMSGTFQRKTLDGIYYIYNDKYYYGSDITAKPYRAWIVGPAPSNNAPFRIEEADAEGLQFVEQEDGTVKAYFDLQGRKLDSARKGLVIENGKIIMVK